MVDTNEVLAQTALEQALHATALDALAMPHLTFLNTVGQHMTSMHSWRWLTVDQARLKVSGNATVTNGNWTLASKTLTAPSGTPLSTYDFVEGHQFEVTAGTNVTVKYVDVVSKTSSAAIVLAEDISTTAGNLANSDIKGTLHATTVELPSDFGSMVSITASDTLVNGMRLVTPGELQRLRTNKVEADSAWSYAGAVMYPGNPPRPVLDIYPELTTTTEDHFSVIYKRGWNRLTSLEDVIRLPDYMLPLYFQLVRAYALGLEDEDVAGVDQRLQVIEAGSTYRAAKNMDWRTQPHFGRMSGGAVARTGSKVGPNALSSEVSGPS